MDCFTIFKNLIATFKNLGTKLDYEPNLLGPKLKFALGIKKKKKSRRKNRQYIYIYNAWEILT